MFIHYHRLNTLSIKVRIYPSIYNSAAGKRLDSTSTIEPTSSTRPLCKAYCPKKTSPENVVGSSLILLPLCLLTSFTNLAWDCSHNLLRYYCACGSSYSKGESALCSNLLFEMHVTYWRRTACDRQTTVRVILSAWASGRPHLCCLQCLNGLQLHDLQRLEPYILQMLLRHAQRWIVLDCVSLRNPWAWLRWSHSVRASLLVSWLLLQAPLLSWCLFCWVCELPFLFWVLGWVQLRLYRSGYVDDWDGGTEVGFGQLV